MTVLTTASYEVLRQMRPTDREILVMKLQDPMMLMFFRRQAEMAKVQIAEMDPSQAKSAEAYMQNSKELRLIWRFWTDLESFAKDWSKSVGETQPQDDGE